MLVFIPFWPFNGTDTKIDSFLLSPLIIYTIVVVGGIWFYSVETNTQPMES
ncbi:hypothetical protein J2W55_001924 [Mucilaginibacter pocheonensis]|uniref:Uncharacterized protein n=1 Tax=Mucilaginibacter pocheonensis TaxID=398050 RepID=A0ABU1T9M5_9SPHI|nr:hypothetical protein [Mucilaginibacter pocheonensis]